MSTPGAVVLSDTVIAGEGSGLGRDSVAGVEFFDLTGTSGSDLMNASAVQNARVTLRGGEGNDLLIGGSGDDLLDGGDGDDILNGSAGNDVLVGGAGRDLFMFTNSMGVDVIIDFDSTDDKIGLDANVFSALHPLVANGDAVLDSEHFVTITSNGTVENALALADTARGHIIYDSATGALIYKRNPNVALDITDGVFAMLQNRPVLQANNLIIMK